MWWRWQPNLPRRIQMALRLVWQTLPRSKEVRAMSLKKKVSILILIFTSGLRLDAQILYGSLIGNVKDSSEAPVAGARVTIRNKETGQSREAVTNDAGGYSFFDVASGTYDVRFAKEG